MGRSNQVLHLMKVANVTPHDVAKPLSSEYNLTQGPFPDKWKVKLDQ